MSKRLLEECLKYTFENVPYYRDTIDKNICLKPLELFKNIPVLNKETVLSNKHLFLSDFYKADYYAGNLIQKHTSGSTGICLEVFWSMLDDAMSNLSAWKYRRKWYDVDPKSKFLSFHSSIYKANHFIEDPEMILYDKDINISVNKLYLTDKNIEYIADKINAFAPVWILVQPSVLYSLINLLKKKENACFFDRIQYIELTGEYLQSGLLSYFKSYFPKAKIANMYGAIEFGTIALECPHGHMHIISNNVYVELTEQNTVLLTSLKNTVMPLLRYEIGDRAVLKKTSCSCGGDDLTIELKAGRIGQNIILPDGNEIPSYVILFVIEKINSEFGGPIIQFKAIQKSQEDIDVYVKLKEGFEHWFTALEAAFQSTITSYLDVKLNWKLVSFRDCDIDLSMKNQFFKSNIKGV